MTNAQQMTETELKTKAAEYDRINNEGGEGYNPYRAELNSRIPAETLTSRIAKLEKAIDYRISGHGKFMHPGEQGKVELAALEAELKTLEAELHEGRKATLIARGWTLDETIARKARWNAEASKPGARPGGVEKVVGFAMVELIEAMEIHGLRSKRAQ